MACTVTKDSEYGSGVDTQVGNNTVRTWIATKFQAGSNYDCCKIGVFLYKNGSPTMNVTLRIYSDNSDAPGSQITNGQGETRGASTFGASETEEVFTFATPPSLVSGTMYWIVLECSTSDGSNHFYWTGHGAGAVEHIMRSGNGTSWTNITAFSTCNFTTYADDGGSGVTVTPAPAATIGGKVDPTTILGSLSLAPSPASAIGEKVNPGTVLGAISVTPSPASGIAGKNEPTVVVGDIVFTPAPASAIGAGVDPVIIGDVIVAPSPADCIAAATGPVTVLGNISLIPSPASALSGIVDPAVVLGNLLLVPTPSSAIGTIVDPTIAGDLVIVPAPASALGASIDPTTILGNLLLTPSPASAVGSVIDPSVIGVIISELLSQKVFVVRSIKDHVETARSIKNGSVVTRKITDKTELV